MQKTVRLYCFFFLRRILLPVRLKTMFMFTVNPVMDQNSKIEIETMLWNLNVLEFVNYYIICSKISLNWYKLFRLCIITDAGF